MQGLKNADLAAVSVPNNMEERQQNVPITAQVSNRQFQLLSLMTRHSRRQNTFCL